MMVAAHKPDLRAAAKCGLKTAFVKRPADREFLAGWLLSLNQGQCSPVLRIGGLTKASASRT